MPRPTQNQLLRDYFLSLPGRWIPMPELGQAIGAWAVHSRVADLRRKFGMKIEQRSYRDRKTGKNLSEYAFLPEGIADSK